MRDEVWRARAQVLVRARLAAQPLAVLVGARQLQDDAAPSTGAGVGASKIAGPNPVQCTGIYARVEQHAYCLSAAGGGDHCGSGAGVAVQFPSREPGENGAVCRLQVAPREANVKVLVSRRQRENKGGQ